MFTLPDILFFMFGSPRQRWWLKWAFTNITPNNSGIDTPCPRFSEFPSVYIHFRAHFTHFTLRCFCFESNPKSGEAIEKVRSFLLRRNSSRHGCYYTRWVIISNIAKPINLVLHNLYPIPSSFRNSIAEIITYYARLIRIKLTLNPIMQSLCSANICRNFEARIYFLIQS